MSRSPWLILILPRRLKPAGARLVKLEGKTKRRIARLLAKWRPKPKRVPIVPLEPFLHDAHVSLLELERRQYLLEAVDAEWPQIVRGKHYWIHGDSAFRALIDVDAMNIIDLCSWGIGASDSDESLLLRVKNHYLDELPHTRRWGLDETSSSLTRLTDQAYAEARNRLFPKAGGRRLAQGDADDLIESFKRRIDSLRHDRNKNRAHAYEHKTHGVAKPLEVTQVRAMYRYAREVLNDLCLIGFGSTWNATDLNSDNVALTAEDLLDVVFLPHWFRRETAGRGYSRVEIYDALHADSTPGHFNDRTKLQGFADRVAT